MKGYGQWIAPLTCCALVACGGGGSGYVQDASGRGATAGAATSVNSPPSIAGQPAATAPAASAANPPVQRSLTLSWQPPTHNDDGSPAPAELRYRVHIGRAPRSYFDSILLPAEATNRFEITAPGAGTYYLAITSLAPDGVESPLSDEVTARLN